MKQKLADLQNSDSYNQVESTLHDRMQQLASIMGQTVAATQGVTDKPDVVVADGTQ